MLLSLLEGIEGYKVIVFIEFHHSIDVISHELKKRKLNFMTLYGETKAPEEVLHRFDNDPTVQVLLLSNAMAAGLNLQVAKYGIYYEIPVSPIVWQQTRRRIERQESQHKTIFIYYLIMRHTVDQQMIAFHKQGRDLWKAILEGKLVL
jgi:SNF2 family DNA or RNA helicase